MPATLSRQDEEKLLRYADQALHQVERGVPPNEAITKVARDQQLTPGEIRLLCAAYNNGRQLAQREHNRSVLTKLSSFDLASADAVIASLFTVPQSEKQASAVDYAPPPSFREIAPLPGLVKQASVQHLSQRQAPNTERKIKAQLAAKSALVKAAQVAGQQATADFLQLQRQVNDWVDYFRVDCRRRAPFAAVKAAALAHYGSVVEPLLELVVQQVPSVTKQAGDRSLLTLHPLDLQSKPLSYLSRCIELASSTQQFRTKQAQIKQANPALTMTLMSQSQRYLGNPLQTKQDMIEDFSKKLDVPAYRSEMRQLAAHKFLRQELTNPNSPLSGYNPNDVLRRYNELAQLSPELADQPTAMRALLTRSMVGNFEPFEAKEVTEMSRNLAMRNAMRDEMLQSSSSSRQSAGKG